jgi:hypothetical protein
MSCRKPALSGLLALALLQGCGGGVDDAALSFGPAPAPAPEPYTAGTADTVLLPWSNEAGDLYLFDPVAPTAPSLLTDTGVLVQDNSVHSPYVLAGPFLVEAGVYDAPTNELRDRHYSHVVYVKSGAVYRVDLRAGRSRTPVRVSSIANACRLYGLTEDFGNPLRSALEVATDCGIPGAVRYVRLDAGGSDAGVLMPTDALIRAPLRNADGSIAGYLVQEGPSTARSLRRYDAAFANPVTIAGLASNTGVIPLAAGSRTQRYLVARPAIASAHGLYRYDAGANALTLLHAFAEVPTSSAADSVHLYFTDAHVLRRVAHAGTTPEVVHTAAVEAEVFNVFLTRERAVMQIDAPDGAGGTRSGIFSLPKAGGDTLTTLEHYSSTYPFVYGTARSRVYYHAYEAGDVVKHANGDGSDARRIDGARVGGFLYRTTLNVGRLDPQEDIRAVLIRSGPYAETTIRVLDAATGVAGPILGTIAQPGGMGTFNQTGRYGMLNVEMFRENTVSWDMDAWAFDTESAGSLRGLGTAVGTDEFPVF